MYWNICFSKLEEMESLWGLNWKKKKNKCFRESYPLFLSNHYIRYMIHIALLFSHSLNKYKNSENKMKK